jgi:hypothetical protein
MRSGHAMVGARWKVGATTGTLKLIGRKLGGGHVNFASLDPGTKNESPRRGLNALPVIF